MTILQAATNGGERREHDYYPTPAACTQALVPCLRRHGFPRRIHEPACGEGGISRVLTEEGYDVVSTDLINRNYGEGGVDFLLSFERSCGGLVTNPPFGKLVSAFIEHAFDLEYSHIAMLVNVNLWHAGNRSKLWRRRQPEAVYALCWKPDFTGAGRPYFNCVWTVWGPRSANETRYERLEKPRQHDNRREKSAQVDARNCQQMERHGASAGAG